MSKNELGLLAICLLRAKDDISAQEMLEDIDKVSFISRRKESTLASYLRWNNDNPRQTNL